jgi:hypothetical protein
MILDQLTMSRCNRTRSICFLSLENKSGYCSSFLKSSWVISLTLLPLSFWFSGGMNGYIALCSGDPSPPVFRSPVDGLEDIMDNQVM